MIRNRIASQLVQMQLDNLGIDYIERRPALIDAVTLDDAKRVAKRLLDSGLLITVVGRPGGVSPTQGGVAASPSWAKMAPSSRRGRARRRSPSPWAGGWPVPGSSCASALPPWR